MSSHSWNALARSFSCDYCAAKPGEPCRTQRPKSNGVLTLAKGVATSLHVSRMRSANAARQADLRTTHLDSQYREAVGRMAP